MQKINKEIALYNTPSPALRASSPSRGEGNNSCSLPPWRGKVGIARMRGYQYGFTLIELLVVVLIIGILAAVAVPQYQKAVEKSKSAQALPLLKSVYQAAKAYKLTHGTWPTTFEVLDVDIPWTGTENWVTTSSSAGKSNGDWSIQLLSANNTNKGVVVGRISGAYQGAAFVLYDVPRTSSGSQEIPTEEIVCVEGDALNNVIKPFTGEQGAYCKKFFKGTLIKTGHANRYYKLP